MRPLYVVAWVSVASLACGNASAPGEADGGAAASRGRCIGRPIDAGRFQDVSSCIVQGENWDPIAKSCNASGQSCESKATETPGYYRDYGAHDCTHTLGCTWETPAGDKRDNPNLGGTCSGTAAPCTAQLYTGCFLDAGCTFSTTNKQCEKLPENPSDAPRCDAFSVPSVIAPTAVHPTAAITRCNAMKGCSFKRVDGTIVDGDLVKP